MRVAIYGGSFNPPHVGHAMVAAWLRWTARADEVWLLPTFQHPFDKSLVPFDRRVELCRALAGAVGPHVRVDTIEASLPVPSFTVDTLHALATRHPEHAFRLVVGADVLPTVAQWRRWDLIEQRYAPIVVGRQGYVNPADTVVFPEILSTDVRRRLADGLPVDHLLPRQVLAALGTLYRDGGKPTIP